MVTTPHNPTTTETTAQPTPPFTPTPYPYQATGAINAAWNGKTLIADEMGLGKTLQALLAARLLNTHRVTIICPPILTANWCAEIRRSNNIPAIHANAELVAITAGTALPEQLPTHGYAVIPDSLLHRPAVRDLLDAWEADLVIFDEAHRFKTPTARRTRAALHTARTATRSIAITGTPIVSSPLDLLPILRILGKLEPVFNSGRAFVDRYSREIPWIPGKREARPEHLPELHTLLEQHVWIRRTKTDVLPQLPAKQRTTHTVTPNPAVIGPAFADLTDRIDQWLTNHPHPTSDDITAFTSDALPFISQLRRATGLAKTTAAAEWVNRHLDEAPTEPVIVWTIHRDVTTQIAAQIAQNRPQTRLRVLDGATAPSARSEAVEAFQDGRVDVLIGQIVAAGVGLTLTRSTTALFAETDWTPANVTQAEDRIHRIGQTRPVTITTLIAEHTLDPRIHEVLHRTINVLDQLTPGSDHHVTTGPGTDTTTPNDLLTDLIHDRMKDTA